MDPTIRLGDSPSRGEDDELKIEMIEHPFRFVAGDEELHALIVDAVNCMGAVGDDAEKQYRKRLKLLRKRADEVLAAVGGEEGIVAAPADAYLDRWSLVQLVNDLRTPGSLGLLKAVLHDEIPEERSNDPHSFTTVGEEVMIRTTAIDGLERLARKGSEDATEILLDVLNHDVFSIRRAATQALVATEDSRTIERVKEVLAERGEEELLRIGRTPVQKVPQATGGLYLVNKERKQGAPPLDESRGVDDKDRN